MDHELVFSIVGVIAMAGWIMLIVSPLAPVWSDRLAGIVIPLFLSLSYATIILMFPAQEGGFGSFSDITTLFSDRNALLAGWIHFLAFDLFIGAWICRKGRTDGVPFWLVLPCLPLTFMFGPAGFMAFLAVRGLSQLLAFKGRKAWTCNVEVLK